MGSPIPSPGVPWRRLRGSELSLSFLSIGVRGLGGGLVGAVWVPVRELPPGQSRVYAVDAYKKEAPEGVELFDLPEPDPSERERYWEFRS